MAKKPKNTKGLSGKTTIIELPFDGSKYVHPLYVGINGMNWLIKRGEPVEIPIEVAEVVNNQRAQDTHTARMMRELSARAQEILD